MKLKKEGFYKELDHGDKDGKSIYDVIREKEGKYDKQICDYLKSGHVLVAHGGIPFDVIDSDKGVPSCPDLLTDGEWIWPGDLEYYVDTYHVELVPEFVQFMKNNNWKINEKISSFDLIEFEEKM